MGSYTCDLLCLASFTRHHVSEAHPWGSRCQDFISFYGWVIFYSVDGPHFLYPVISGQTSELFWIVTLWIFAYRYSFEYQLSVLWGLYRGVGLLSQMVILCGCPILSSHQQGLRVSISHQHVSFPTFLFKIVAILRVSSDLWLRFELQVRNE